MLLREYLYVDTAVVRGILAQIESGIDETSVEAKKHEKQSQVGAKGILGHSAAWGDTTTTEKSLGDALFPRLELALESEGLLVDVSEELTNADGWKKDSLSDDYPPGMIVRITAPGWLFDARFISSLLTGFATAVHGLNNVGAFDENANTTATMPPKAKAQRNRESGNYKGLPDESANLEGAISTAKIHMGGDEGDIDGKFLRGIIQVSRGIFAPGVHRLISKARISGVDILVSSHFVARMQQGAVKPLVR